MNIVEQTFAFLYSCLLGVWFGALYDLFRVSRIAFKLGKIIIFIEDVAYFVIVTVCSFVFIITDNNGVLRGFLLFGELLGIVIYFFTLSILFMRIARFIIKLLKKIFGFVFSITFVPIIKLLGILFSKFKQNFVNLWHKIKEYYISHKSVPAARAKKIKIK